MMTNKPSVIGTVIDVTPTHYITEDADGRSMWNREHYRLVKENAPQTSPPTPEGLENAQRRLLFLNAYRKPIEASKPRHPYDRDFDDE